MSIIFSHPTGNANVRAALQGIYNANLLAAFYTGIASFEGGFLDNLGAYKLFGEIRRRSFNDTLKPFTHSIPWREAGRLLALKAKLSSLTRHETGYFSVDAVYHHQDKQVAQALHSKKNSNVKAVYCYEDGAAFTFAEARKSGIKTLYDLPIGYWRTARELLKNEQNRWPEWKATLTGFMDSEQKLKRKDEELRLADVIFVASSFTAKTLKNFPGKLPLVHIIPYGFPHVTENKDYSGIGNRKKLKLLFVGGLSQRKGIADLFFAVNALQDYVELTVVGKKSTEECPALNLALSKHKWIPGLPHHEILQLMRQQDVLVFPSLFEGFGLVITEAMSQGLPVITTERTAGPDLIEHAGNGWLIEAGSAIALQHAIEHFIQQPAQAIQLGKEALETARLRPWTVYGTELAAAIEKTMNK